MYTKLKLTTVAALSIFASSQPAAADEWTQAYAQQGYLSFTLLQGNIPVNGGVTIVSPLGGFFSNGPSNFYPRIRCENGKRTLDSVQLFSGMAMSHKVEGKELVLDISQYSVSSPDAEIQALKDNECKNLSPQQKVVFKRTVKVPYQKSDTQKVIALEDGYTLRFEALPPPSQSN